MLPFLVSLVATIALLLAACTAAPTPAPTPTIATLRLTPVRVVVPEANNLQFLNFWVALGAGFFKEEGLDVQIIAPPNPQGGPQFLLQGRGDVALLPPPMYLPLIGQEQPIVIFANLFQNDPLNLVVRKEVAEARKLNPNAPLLERLKGLQGLKIGIASGPLPRLRTLLAAAGMDADRDVQVQIIQAEQQNQALAQNQVDALHAHTPQLEKAIVEQGAMLLVNQSKGEVPELAAVNIHSLVTTRSYAAANPVALVSLTRAIYRAQKLIHSDKKAAVDALLLQQGAGLERRLADSVLAIYEPAVPQTPEVTIERLMKANKYFYLGAPPDLSKINLADYIAPQIARQAVTGTP